MGERVLSTIQALSEVAKTRSEGEWGVNSGIPRKKEAKAQDNDKGHERRGVYRSLGVRGWSGLNMNSPGVEISIARGVEEMIRGQIPSPFFYFLFYHACFLFVD